MMSKQYWTSLLGWKVSCYSYCSLFCVCMVLPLVFIVVADSVVLAFEALAWIDTATNIAEGIDIDIDIDIDTDVDIDIDIDIDIEIAIDVTSSIHISV